MDCIQYYTAALVCTLFIIILLRVKSRSFESCLHFFTNLFGLVRQLGTGPRLTLHVTLALMSTSAVQLEDTDPGVLLGADPERQYAWGERAAVIRKLALNYPELTHTEIARRADCLPANVDQVLSRFLGVHSVTDLRDLQANKADIFDSLQLRTLASITDEDIAKAPYMARITGAAILEDKSRLVRGQPTSIHVHALVDVLDALRMRDGEE